MKRLLCPGLVKPILRHSFGRSWYMRLFHTPGTSFVLTTRLLKHNSCSGFIFIPGKNLRAPCRAFLNSSVHKSTTWNQTICEKFQWLLLTDRPFRIYLRWVTSEGIVCYPITATSRFWTCHTICWMVLWQAFLSLLPSPPSPILNLLSPSPLGRSDTQAIFRLSSVPHIYTTKVVRYSEKWFHLLLLKWMDENWSLFLIYKSCPVTYKSFQRESKINFEFDFHLFADDANLFCTTHNMTHKSSTTKYEYWAKQC